MKTKLKAEKQSYKKTQQKLEEGKTRDGKGNDTKEIDITAVGLQKTETTTESLSEKEQDEGKQKEIERDSARGENQPSRKEVKELKNIIPKKSGDYQPKIKALQRDEGGERKERKNLQLLPPKLEAAKEEQKQEVGQLQRKATRPERTVSEQISEVTREKGKKKKKKKKKRTTTQKVRCCRREFVAADTEAKIDFLPQVGKLGNKLKSQRIQMSEKEKRLLDASNAESSKFDSRRKVVRRFEIKVEGIKGQDVRKCLVLLLPHCRDFLDLEKRP